MGNLACLQSPIIEILEFASKRFKFWLAVTGGPSFHSFCNQ
jgi:hypothetical protein